MAMPVFVLLTMVWMAAQVPANPGWPAGLQAVHFGKGERYKNPSGKEMCAIPKPLATPAVFERGVTEISYGVMLQPRTVKSAATRVTSPAEQPLQSVSCIAGGFSQTQLGATISRTDKAPLRSGAYTLQVTVDGQVAQVPFTVR
jgi:hypothetical protein